MDTLVADITCDTAINEVSDKRTKNTLKNIKEACQTLVKQRVNVNPTSVGTECLEQFGKPSTQTLRNDPKGIYQPIISAYAKFNSDRNKSYKNKKTAKDLGIPTNVKIKIDMLEKRNSMLENILTEQFSMTADKLLPSISDTLQKGASVSDGARVAGSNALTQLQKKALSKLYAYGLDVEADLVKTMGSEKLLMGEIGTIVLNAREFAAFISLINTLEE